MRNALFIIVIALHAWLVLRLNNGAKSVLFSGLAKLFNDLLRGKGLVCAGFKLCKFSKLGLLVICGILEKNYIIFQECMIILFFATTYSMWGIIA